MKEKQITTKSRTARQNRTFRLSDYESRKLSEGAIVARINSEGLVGISPYIDAYFGDLKKESLKEIWDRMKMGWHNPEMLELAKKMDERGNGTLIDTLEERLMIGEV